MRRIEALRRRSREIAATKKHVIAFSGVDQKGISRKERAERAEQARWLAMEFIKEGLIVTTITKAPGAKP